HYDAAYLPMHGAFTGPGTTKGLAMGAAAISAGTDLAGKAMTDVLFGSGQAWEYSDSHAPKLLRSGVTEVEAGLGGMSDVVTPALGGGVGNDIWRFQDGGPFPDSWSLVLRNSLA